MPKQQLDNELKVDADLRANLERTRDNISNALKDVRGNRHAQDWRDLQTRQDQIAGQNALSGKQNLESTLAGQRNLLELQHSGELDLINKALDAATRIETTVPNGSLNAKQFLDAAVELNNSLVENTKRTLAAVSDDLSKTLAIGSAGQRNEKLDELGRNQELAAELFNRDLKVATAELERREALAYNVIDKDQRDTLRAVLTETSNTEKVRGLFTDQLIQRLADEALCPGKKPLETVHEDAAIQRVKGELAERIAGADIRAEIERENKTRPQDHQLFLIEGDRIRDEQGKKISDGLIVWRDAENKLQIWEALEVKSGPHAARELNYKIEKLTEHQDEELRKYALDRVRDTFKEKEGLTAAQLQVEIERRAKEEETALRSRQVQKESGQREQTTERLDLIERIYIDGQAHEATIDRERRLGDVVKKVSTDEAIKKDLEVQRLGVVSRDLEFIAKAFVEELLRQREKP
jgi:hypothetical protein